MPANELSIPVSGTFRQINETLSTANQCLRCIRHWINATFCLRRSSRRAQLRPKTKTLVKFWRAGRAAHDDGCVAREWSGPILDH